MWSLGGGPSIGGSARSNNRVVFVVVGSGPSIGGRPRSNNRVVFVVVGRAQYRWQAAVE